MHYFEKTVVSKGETGGSRLFYRSDLYSRPTIESKWTRLIDISTSGRIPFKNA